MLKAASFNVNSIRARLELVLDWLARERPDVLCLQETKVEDGDFPLQELQRAGYNAVFKGQKLYNGVAVVSPHPLEEVRTGIGDWAEPGEARLIAVAVRGLPVVNTYIPQGRDPIFTGPVSHTFPWPGDAGVFFDPKPVVTGPGQVIFGILAVFGVVVLCCCRKMRTGRPT
ncbi:exodeoxyribonuclease III [Desulforudis sp. DRI-14]|uniref:exodeoxyribonuclease III n=1 Tax=Desulforudis sp. DRI-14 TaxID=3459793 RepID=UPI004041840D